MNRLRHLWALVAILGAGLLAGCGHVQAGDGASAAAMGAEVADSRASIGFEEAQDRKWDGKEVQLTGYLQLPKFMLKVRNTAVVDLFERPAQRHGNSVGLKLQLGDCPNCMAELPKNFTRADLRVRDRDGREVAAQARLRVTGTLAAAQDQDGRPTLTVTDIEALPPQEVDFAGLEALAVTAQNAHDSSITAPRLAVAQGRLAMPSMVFIDGDLTLNMAVGAASIGVNFRFGTGPNELEELPENFTARDLKLHDHAGKLIQFGRPVKVWGVRSAPEGIIFAERVEQ